MNTENLDTLTDDGFYIAPDALSAEEVVNIRAALSLLVRKQGAVASRPFIASSTRTTPMRESSTFSTSTRCSGSSFFTPRQPAS